MTRLPELGRRMFLKTAGTTALAGLAHSSAATSASASTAFQSYATQFDFDTVFTPTSTNDEIYTSVAHPMITNTIFKGFNGTILAYGQTGSGKTHTMGTNFNAGNSPDAGITPRSVSTIFSTAASYKGTTTINISYLEIYNEEVKDLLAPPSSRSISPVDPNLGVPASTMARTARM